MTDVHGISEKGSSQEVSMSVSMKAKLPEMSVQQPIDNDKGSNAAYVPELNPESGKLDNNYETKEVDQLVQIEDGGEEDKQSAMLMVAENLHTQLTRLQGAPSVKNWNSIARFFEKSKILDELEKDAQEANKQARSKTLPNKHVKKD